MTMPPDSVASLWIERLRLNTLKRKARIVKLSGVNQQNVVVATSLAQDPEVVIFDEPTRGVDVSDILEIHSTIRRLANERRRWW